MFAREQHLYLGDARGIPRSGRGSGWDTGAILLTPENIVVGLTDGVLVDGTLLYTECKITATIQKMSQVQVRNVRKKLQNKTRQKNSP